MHFQSSGQPAQSVLGKAMSVEEETREKCKAKVAVKQRCQSIHIKAC